MEMNCISRTCKFDTSSGNNWATDDYTEGAEIIDQVVDMIRKEAESRDCSQGFQITYVLRSGIGSGLGTLLLMKIRDKSPDRITASFNLYPSPKVLNVVVEPTNAILSIHQLSENSDETFVIISQNISKQPQPKYAESNWVISSVMSGIFTVSLRFSGKLNGDSRKMSVNSARAHVNVTVQEITHEVWSSRNFFSKYQT